VPDARLNETKLEITDKYFWMTSGFHDGSVLVVNSLERDKEIRNVAIHTHHPTGTCSILRVITITGWIQNIANKITVPFEVFVLFLYIRMSLFIQIIPKEISFFNYV